MSVKIIDKGWKKIQKSLKGLDNSFVNVGLFASKEAKVKSKKKKDSLNIAQIASVNEYGDPENKIPSRPFLRFALQNNTNILRDFKVKLLRKIYDRKIEYPQALKQLGQLHTKHIKETIKNSSLFKANAESTFIRKMNKGRKGSSGIPKPLIDTGRMLASVTYEVHDE